MQPLISPILIPTSLLPKSKGLELVFENVQTLAYDAAFLCEAQRPRGGKILLAFAEEEAAKILIRSMP
jgi:hypothetical protein